MSAHGKFVRPDPIAFQIPMRGNENHTPDIEKSLAESFKSPLGVMS